MTKKPNSILLILLFALFFTGGILLGIWYGDHRRTKEMPIASLQMGDTAMTFVSLHMLDKTSPEATRQYLTRLLASELIALDLLMTEYPDYDQKAGKDLFRRISEHIEEHPLNLNDPGLSAKVDKILTETKKSTNE